MSDSVMWHVPYKPDAQASGYDTSPTRKDENDACLDSGNLRAFPFSQKGGRHHWRHSCGGDPGDEQQEFGRERIVSFDRAFQLEKSGR